MYSAAELRGLLQAWRMSDLGSFVARCCSNNARSATKDTNGPTPRASDEAGPVCFCVLPDHALLTNASVSVYAFLHSGSHTHASQSAL